MRVTNILPWLTLAATLLAGEPSHAAGPGSAPLGGNPVCEASAAVVVPCATGGGRCLLVGDNEQRDRLFAYRLRAGGPDVASREALSFAHLLDDLDPDEREISDVEALVALGGGGVLVVASHSRNKACKPRKKRRRLLGVTWGEGGLERHPRWGFEQAKKPGCKRLFGRKRGDLSGQMRTVCAAIEAAETAADSAARGRSPAACEAAASLNVEGGLAAAPGTGPTRVWLGLRTPLVDGAAVVMRSAGPGAKPAFDATALLVLGGRGVRAMATHGRWGWLVAGPPEDDVKTAFELWRFPLDALVPGATVEPERVSSLANGAEGLALDGSSAIVVTDGDQPEEGAAACRRDAGYAVVPVPGP